MSLGEESGVNNLTFSGAQPRGSGWTPSSSDTDTFLNYFVEPTSLSVISHFVGRWKQHEDIMKSKQSPLHCRPESQSSSIMIPWVSSVTVPVLKGELKQKGCVRIPVHYIFQHSRFFLYNDALQFLFWHIQTPTSCRIAPGHSKKAQIIHKLKQAVELERSPLFKKMSAEIRQISFEVSSRPKRLSNKFLESCFLIEIFATFQPHVSSRDLGI